MTVKWLSSRGSYAQGTRLLSHWKESTLRALGSLKSGSTERSRICRGAGGLVILSRVAR